MAFVQGTKTAYRQPMFRTNTHRDPPDILDPVFDKCSLPLIWWPWWPFNAGQALHLLLALHLDCQLLGPLFDVDLGTVTWHLVLLSRCEIAVCASGTVQCNGAVLVCELTSWGVMVLENL